ncbi:MAG: hypothetical protein HYZ28_16555 [Myxococcales bacterium]|nr:hypothetical protein [Myxococcales bacterium]
MNVVVVGEVNVVGSHVAVAAHFILAHSLTSSKGRSIKARMFGVPSAVHKAPERG